MTLDPPDPFDAAEDRLAAGALLYRVHSNVRRATEFNPGVGSRTRFAFFGDPIVPVLYAAETEQAAIAETPLHDVPPTGGILPYAVYSDTVMSRIVVGRTLRLASLRGLGLRRLGAEARDVTDTDASDYVRTVKWAEAAHRAAFDGLSWTARKCNDARAVVLFGDRCGDAVDQDEAFARIFQTGPGLDWLISTCGPLRVDVLPPAPRW